MEAGPGDGENPSTAPTPARPDFSFVQGFQVVGADLPGAGQNGAGGEYWRDALRLELETRASRFHHAVDSAIVLSNEGVIRWLGDPIARLSPGPGVLTPGAVILADEALPVAGQDVVKARVDLWLAAMTRRVLGPLFVLDAFQEGSEVVRDLAGRLARSLGILEREPIREQIKALAQNERAELRKHGVRFRRPLYFPSGADQARGEGTWPFSSGAFRRRATPARSSPRLPKLQRPAGPPFRWI